MISSFNCEAENCENNEGGDCPFLYEELEEIELDENGTCMYYAKWKGVAK